MSEEIDLFKSFGVPPPLPFNMDLPVHIGESHNELRLIFVHHLTKLGFKKIESTRDGLDMLSSLKNSACEIAIFAKDLEKVSGLDLAKELSENPQLLKPANILITVPPGRSEIMNALEAGIDDFLIKPVVQGDIILKMKSAYKVFNNPKNPERVYEFAKKLFKKNDFDKAFSVYEKLALLNAKAARPHVGKARIYAAKNKDIEAIQELDTGLTKNPNYVHAFELRGQIHLKLGDKEKALADLQKAISISPLNLSRYDACCQLMLDAENIKGCISILESANKQGLEDAFIIERLGFCYFLEKDYQQALKYLKEAVRMDPDNIKYLNSLAICYRDEKEFDKAVEVYNRIIKKEPSNQQVLFNKALTLKYMKKFDEAEKLFHRVAELDPQNSKVKEQLAAVPELRKTS